MITKKDNTTYYQTTTDILAWQGICPTNIPENYIIAGTLKTNFGAIYKGTIDIPDASKIETVIFPNSTSTQVYGPDYVENYDNNYITLVGSYQTGTVGINDPCKGFGYKGAYDDFNNPNNYFMIEPPIPFKFTVVHSTRGGLAVYISSDLSQLNFIFGKSFLYDIDLKLNLVEIKFPNSLFTTTYGIWYNGKINCYDTYTISGGFSLTGLFFDTRTFVVDLLYNKLTGETLFLNWTEIAIPGISIYTHAQGITGLDNCNYILPIANFFIDPIDNTKLTEFSGGKVEIKRFLNTFIVVNYEAINFPNSNLTIVTSAAENSVVGVYVNTNNETLPFQAITQ